MITEAIASILILLNSGILLASVLVLVPAFQRRKLIHQLRILKFLTSYALLTFLLDVYMLGFMGTMGGSALIPAALLLASASIVILWLLVYRLWGEG